jgi:hypothetical protein
MSRFVTLVALLCALYAGYRWGEHAEPAPATPSPPPSRVVVENTPSTIVALRRLARLEVAEFAIERVIDARDQQSHLFGLVQAEDAVLLIAGGRVSAGVDLTDLPEHAVVANWEARTVEVHLPPVRVLTSHLDEGRTYVHTRKTDAFAIRKESLETDARRAAESELEQAAIQGGILKMGTDNARSTVESLLLSLGFQKATITFAPHDRAGAPTSPEPRGPRAPW